MPTVKPQESEVSEQCFLTAGREDNILVWALGRIFLTPLVTNPTRRGYSIILLLHRVQPVLTLLSSWISQSLEKVASCCPWEQFENWKRLENILLFS